MEYCGHTKNKQMREIRKISFHTYSQEWNELSVVVEAEHMLASKRELDKYLKKSQLQGKDRLKNKTERIAWREYAPTQCCKFL